MTGNAGYDAWEFTTYAWNRDPDGSNWPDTLPADWN